MKLDSLEKLLEQQLQDLHSAESQLVKALKKMANAADGDTLKQAFTSHLEESKIHIERLDQIGQMLPCKLTGNKCEAMEGLIEEGEEAIDADGSPRILDLALIAAAQRIEHYEISAYGISRVLAEHMGHNDVASLLRQTENEEAAADKKLTQITLKDLLPKVDVTAHAGKG